MAGAHARSLSSTPILLGKTVNGLIPQRPEGRKSSMARIVSRRFSRDFSILRGTGKPWDPGVLLPCTWSIGVFNRLSVMLDLAAFAGLRPRKLGSARAKEVAREWRNGRRAGFRCQYPKGCGGSNPPSRTQFKGTPVFGTGFLSFNSQLTGSCCRYDGS